MRAYTAVALNDSHMRRVIGEERNQAHGIDEVLTAVFNQDGKFNLTIYNPETLALIMAVEEAPKEASS